MKCFRGDDVSDGLIEFAPNPTNSTEEGTLMVVKLIDRESQDIIDRNGFLSFTVIVSDAAGLSVQQEVDGLFNSS